MFLEYKHIINPRLKHTYLSIDEEGLLIIKSPKVPTSYINKLVISKAQWINQARAKQQHKKAKLKDIWHNKELYLWGERYTVEFYLNSHSSYSIKNSHIVICYKDIDSIDYIIYDIYKDQAKEHIPPLVEKLAKQMELYPNRLSFRRTKRQWGSCSAKNNISLNTMLAKLPKDLVQYIIIHELSHIRYKNHQREFWSLVAKYEPRYKQLTQELKEYQTI